MSSASNWALHCGKVEGVIFSLMVVVELRVMICESVEYADVAAMEQVWRKNYSLEFLLL